MFLSLIGLEGQVLGEGLGAWFGVWEPQCTCASGDVLMLQEPHSAPTDPSWGRGEEGREYLGGKAKTASCTLDMVKV